jgi:hypothetical protein
MSRAQAGTKEVQLLVVEGKSRGHVTFCTGDRAGSVPKRDYERDAWVSLRKHPFAAAAHVASRMGGD